MSDVTLAELPVQVALALSLASSSTGVDYDYLVRTAQRESSFRVDAKASTSSAEGLFQFIDETWIRTLKDDGPALGLGAYADKITKTDDGRYVFADPKDRELVLDLRKDANVSALMAGAFSRRNEERLSAELGRAPSSGELYIAHLLGAGDAIRLIKVRNVDMAISASELFPRAAAANRSLFYRDGKPLSVGDLYDRLIALHSKRPKLAAAALDLEPAVGSGSWKADTARRIVFTKEEAAELGWAFLNKVAEQDNGAFGFGRKTSRSKKVAAVEKPLDDASVVSDAWSTAVEPADDARGSVALSGWETTGEAEDTVEALAKVVAKAKVVQSPKLVIAADGKNQLLGGLEVQTKSESSLLGLRQDAEFGEILGVGAGDVIGEIALVTPSSNTSFGLRSNTD